MNRLFELVNTIGQVKSSWDTVFLRNIESTLEDHNVMNNPYEKSDLVYICISTTARAIAQVPLQVGRSSEEGEWQTLPDTHPWVKLMKRPNYLLDRSSFVEAVISHLMLDGDVWVVPFPTDYTSVPQSLWVVPKRFMVPLRDRSTGQLQAWRYRPGQGMGEFVLEADRVCHLWFWNPKDPLLGLSPLVAGKMSIVGDFKAAYYNLNFFDEGAQPGGVLSTDQKLSDKQFERLRNQIENRHKSYKRSHRLMLLEQGLKYTQTTISQRDMQFYDLRRFNQERILQIFGMKKAVISVTDDLNYATAREQRKSWWQDTNLPLMRMMLSGLNFVFMRDREERFRFDVSSIEALQEDFGDKVQTAERLVKMGFTANEVNRRLDLGFEEKPWRDYFYVPQGLIPVGGNGGAAQQQETITVQPEPVRPALPEVKASTVEDTTWDRQVEEGLWKELMQKLSTVENRTEKALRRVVYQMRRSVLRALYKGTKDIGDVNGLDLEAETRELRRILNEAYRDALQIGWKSVVDEVGLAIEFPRNDPVVVQFLAEKNLKLVGITRTIKRRVAEALARGTEAGESLDQIARRLKDEFNFAAKRTRTIARTEVVGANNFSRHIALDRTDYTEFRWFTALDERVRPSHASMHGKTRRKGEPWVVGGASLRHPGDPRGPAGEVINCRCIEVVVPGSRHLPTTEEHEEPGTPQERLRELLKEHRDSFSSTASVTKETVFRKRFNTWREGLRKIVDDAGGVDEIDLGLLRLSSTEKSEQVLEKVFMGSLSSGARRRLVKTFTYAGEEVLGQLSKSRVRLLSRGPARGQYEMLGLNSYKAPVGEIRFQRKPTAIQVLHEMGHHLEALARSDGGYKPVKALTEKAAAAWRDSRARAAHGGRLIKKPLRDIQPEVAYGPVEVAVVQGFISPYVGKIYASGETEVVSMGLQQFVSEKSIRAFMKADWDHFAFTYGVLAGVL